jgi:hypothetical protein
MAEAEPIFSTAGRTPRLRGSTVSSDHERVHVFFHAAGDGKTCGLEIGQIPLP